MKKESEEIKNKEYEQRESLSLDWHQDIVFKKIMTLWLEAGSVMKVIIQREINSPADHNVHFLSLSLPVTFFFILSFFFLHLPFTMSKTLES